MNGWQTKMIGEVATINPPKPKFHEWDLDKEVDFLPMSALIVDAPNPFPTEQRKIKDVIKGYTCFQSDDILLAKITPCFENGKCGIFKKSPDGVGFGSTEFIVIRANTDEVLSLWIWLFLSDKRFRQVGQLHMVGSAGQRRLPTSFVADYQVPIPPLIIQKQIIEKLNVVRELLELNQKEIEKEEELFNSFVSGQITRENNAMLSRFGDIAEFQYGLTTEGRDKGVYRFIRITDISEAGRLRSEDKKYTGVDEKEAKPYILESGDLLVARTGATYGKFLLFESQEPSVFASYLIRVRPDPKLVKSRFIWLFTRTGNYWNQARKFVTGSGQPQFNANRIKEIMIHLPPLDEQELIITKAEQLLIYMDTLLTKKVLLNELFESMINKLIIAG